MDVQVYQTHCILYLGSVHFIVCEIQKSHIHTEKNYYTPTRMALKVKPNTEC